MSPYILLFSHMSATDKTHTLRSVYVPTGENLNDAVLQARHSILLDNYALIDHWILQADETDNLPKEVVRIPYVSRYVRQALYASVKDMY